MFYLCGLNYIIMVIGITGGIGCGKSHVRGMFEYMCGVETIDTDHIVQEKLMYYISVASTVIKEFGEESYIDGRLNREMFHDILYGNPANLARMNNIVLPYLIDYISSVASRTKNLIVECPIILNTDIHRHMDKTILVTCDMRKRMERLRMRYNDDRNLINRKINSQSFDESKADYILRNDNQLEAEVKKLVEEFGMSYSDNDKTCEKSG